MVVDLIQQQVMFICFVFGQPGLHDFVGFAGRGGRGLEFLHAAYFVDAAAAHCRAIGVFSLGAVGLLHRVQRI